MRTTAELLTRSVRDAPAFGGVYRAHSRTVLAYLARRTWDPEVALELTAETFAQAFASRRRFRGDTDDDVAAWLVGIARHVLAHFVRKGRSERSALRRLGVEVPPLEPDDVVRIVELAGLADLRGAVARTLATLPSEHREAVRLRVVEELSYADVASRLDVSEPTARARVSRGLRSLAKTLERNPIPREGTT
ncbi:MAG TPA: RNA polymerase sigma factor [Solirubrobacteraceae bacterium]|nr:RNA polymerase sigma factor [Solirubrobacteraceae bacterium]